MKNDYHEFIKCKPFNGNNSENLFRDIFLFEKLFYTHRPHTPPPIISLLLTRSSSPTPPNHCTNFYSNEEKIRI